MRREGITLIWFTGIVSQYNISSYDIANLKINHNTLNNIFNTYKADKYIALISVRNDLERQQYLNLIIKEKLEDKLIFIFFGINDLYQEIIHRLASQYNITYYIDCSRRRLVSVSRTELISLDRLIHISQLLN